MLLKVGEEPLEQVMRRICGSYLINRKQLQLFYGYLEKIIRQEFMYTAIYNIHLAGFLMLTKNWENQGDGSSGSSMV